MTLIRLATADDQEALWPMLRDVFRAGETYAVPRDISKAAAIQLWCETPTATFVAKTAGRISGSYYIKPNQMGGGAHVCNCGYIVSPVARGQGIAAQMCIDSQARARDLGFRAMQFNLVLTSNAGALRLWSRLGFETIGTLPAAFAHPSLGYVDACVMHKALL